MHVYCVLFLCIYAAAAESAISCGAGRYVATPSSCALCPVRHWKNGTNQKTVCDPCPLGSGQTLSGGISLAACVCDPGFSGANGGPCVQCEEGKYKSVAGSSSCIAAKAIQCPPGRHRVPLVNVCTQCPANTWKNGTNNATFCDRDDFVHQRHLLTTGTSLCVECYAGTYSETFAAISIATCVDCLPGTYSGTSGAVSISSCLECMPGTYSGTSGAALISTCVDCLPGTYSGTSGAGLISSCLECMLGKYSGTSGAALISTCVDCLPGVLVVSARCTL